jgi:putative heme-binding domain-containing protein
MRFSFLLRTGVAAAFFAAFGCSDNQVTEQPTDEKVGKLKYPANFRVEHLYSPSENNQGSWVAMTFDSKGRLITSDQYGSLYRLELPAAGQAGTPTVEKLRIGPPDDPAADTTVGMGYAQGLLYAFNSLYVMVNHRGNKDFERTSGLYRLQDTDGDDQYDKVTLLKSLEGNGEHGPHSVVLAPDQKSIYVVAGNHTDTPEFDAYRLPRTWQEDNLFPLIKDPRGHANNVAAPGGWIARTDSLGQHWELIAAGFRNTFDITFNEHGELFAYDSDMEWDFGMPWYRPTRICHVTSGAEFGWRTGNSKWSPAWPDNLPAVINIGQGSPTNFVAGHNAKFPERYRKALFAFDWSFGIIYAVHLKPKGASYTAEAEEFLSGAPLPLTDGVFGPDGALYFMTGGRRLESDLYRVYFEGDEGDVKNVLVTDEGTQVRELRKSLEAYHGKPHKDAVANVWPHLKHEDRFVRYAARVALEHQPVSAWSSKALQEPDDVIRTQAIIALARQPRGASAADMLTALMRTRFEDLTEAGQVDFLRAVELVLLRRGTPSGAIKNNLVAYLNPHFPARSNALNRELSKLLVYLEAPGAVEKTVALLENAADDPEEETASASSDLILRNPQYGLDIAGMLSKVPPRQQTYYATVLSQAKTGWSPALRDSYFNWFRKAFGYKGGMSYIGFINKARVAALEHVPTDEEQHYRTLSGEELLAKSGNEIIEGPQPKGPGRRWKLDDAVGVVENNLKGRDFKQGKAMYDATRCSSCHMMRGEGSAVGPDLTQLGTRFSVRDMLEAIIDPNKTVSDQYAATVFTMKDGSSILGRLVNEDDTQYYVSQNPFTPEVLREVPKEEVVDTKYSYISIMYPGLINSLNEEELKDLIAYLMAGGNENHELYQ